MPVPHALMLVEVSGKNETRPKAANRVTNKVIGRDIATNHPKSLAKRTLDNVDLILKCRASGQGPLLDRHTSPLRALRQGRLANDTFWLGLQFP